MFRRRRRTDTDFSEELRAHLELEADRLREQGFSDEDARAMAHLNLGNIMNIEERFYEAGRWMWLEQLLQDIRYASRQLRGSKAFTLVCVLTLALGIGANTAVFTLVHAVMLKSLPVTDPKMLYSVGDGSNCCVIGGYQHDHSIFSYSLYQYLRDHTPEFIEMAGFQASPDVISVRQGGASAIAQPFVGQFVSGNYFATFGVPAYAGRVIQPADDVHGAPPVAVMSYRAWQEHHALDPAVVGSVFVMDGWYSGHGSGNRATRIFRGHTASRPSRLLDPPSQRAPRDIEQCGRTLAVYHRSPQAGGAAQHRRIRTQC